MNPDCPLAWDILTVRVTDELVLTVGSWKRVRDGQNRFVARIEPPEMPMFMQAVQYLEAKPLLPPVRFGAREEARAAVAVCLRHGSYFAALTDPSRPFAPSVAEQDASRIDDDEMARLNVEISAAVAWWFHLKGSDNQRYRSLVQRALACLPLGRKTVRRSSEGEALLTCASRAISSELQRAWPAEWLERDLILAATHPIRVIANAVTLKSWRNGPIEDVHAGRSIVSVASTTSLTK